MSAAFSPLRAAAPRSAAFDPAFGAAKAAPEPVQEPELATDAAVAHAALIETARTAGYAAGLHAGQRATESLGQERIVASVEALTSAFDQVKVQAEAAAVAAARDLALLMLTMIEAALPGLIAQRGPELVRALADGLRSRLMLLHLPRLAVPPGLAEVLAPVLRGTEVTLIEDPSLCEGDAVLDWDTGVLRLDRVARMAALREVLAQCGIGMEG